MQLYITASVQLILNPGGTKGRETLLSLLIPISIDKNSQHKIVQIGSFGKNWKTTLLILICTSHYMPFFFLIPIMVQKLAFFRRQAENPHDFNQQNSSVTSVTQKQNLCHLDVINSVKRKGKCVSLPIHYVLFDKDHQFRSG